MISSENGDALTPSFLAWIPLICSLIRLRACVFAHWVILVKASRSLFAIFPLCGEVSSCSGCRAREASAGFSPSLSVLPFQVSGSCPCWVPAPLPPCNLTQKCGCESLALCCSLRFQFFLVSERQKHEDQEFKDILSQTVSSRPILEALSQWGWDKKSIYLCWFQEMEKDARKSSHSVILENLYISKTFQRNHGQLTIF